MKARAHPAGATLVELLFVLLILGVLLSLAVPSFRAQIQRQRVRAVLDRVTSDLFYARAVAARNQVSVSIRLNPAGACVEAYEVRTEAGRVVRVVRVAEEYPGVCLTTNAPRELTVNARGLLIGSPRKLRATSGTQADSLSISIVGRVLRW